MCLAQFSNFKSLLGYKWTKVTSSIVLVFSPPFTTTCLVLQSWANDLDRDSSGTPKGLLHGVPVSIKEYFGMKGYDGSLAILNWLNRPAVEDSVLIKVSFSPPFNNENLKLLVRLKNAFFCPLSLC